MKNRALHTRARFLFFGGALFCSPLACSASTDRSVAGGGAPGVDSSTHTGGQASGGKAGTPGLALPDSGSCASSTCSSDLRNVIACGVPTPCPVGKACSAGACIDDACQAATNSKSSYGCEYWALNAESPFWWGCYAAYVANTWSEPVHINVERAGTTFVTSTFARIPNGQGPELTYQPYDEALGVPPGEVAILFLSDDPSGPAGFPHCPDGIAPAVSTATGVTSTGLGDAFHIVTDAPVVAYQMYPYGGAIAATTSATLLLPTSAWDKNYIAIDGYLGRPSLSLVAAEDDTEVSIAPVAAIEPGEEIPGGADTQNYTLNRGQFLQLTSALDAPAAMWPELTGSVVLANKPFGFFGATPALSLPDGTCCWDSAHQQIPPIQAWGNEYVAVRYRSRKGSDEVVPWRFVGAVDGTTLSYAPAPPDGAPTSLGRGQMAEFSTSQEFVVKSQDADHPFYAAGYMTAGLPFDDLANPVKKPTGDPEWVNLVSPAQFLDGYVFFTDPTYSETELIVVRRRGASGGFEDVTLDCAGTLSGFQPVGDYEYLRVELVSGFAGVGACGAGRHTMQSSAPFGVTVWGWDHYVSYAYPAGMGVRAINQVVVTPPVK